MSPAYLALSLVVSRVEKSKTSVYLPHSLVESKVEKSRVSGLLSSFSCSV